jgi:RNA polymerase sigma-70 factor (ECF subfamily)
MEEDRRDEAIPDEELMKSLQAGSEDAFDELVTRYAAKITNFIYRQVAHFSTAEEIAQDTFLAVYRKRDTFKPEHSFSPWLYKIAINFCRMHFRKKRSMPTLLSIEESQEEGREGLGRDLVDGREGPLDAVSRKDAEDKLRLAVASLPPKQRLVFTLSFYEERTYEEISRLLGCSPGTVASRKHAAVRKLASRLRVLSPGATVPDKGQRNDEESVFS